MRPTHTDEGLRTALAIRERHPSVAVLVLSQHVDLASAGRAMVRNARGLGYLLKPHVADIGELAEAIHRVARGESVIDPAIVERMRARRRAGSPLDELTPRERAVLALMAEGHSNEAITRRLGVASKTVETHVRSIFAKLNLEPTLAYHRRVLAVLAYLKA